MYTYIACDWGFLININMYLYVTLAYSCKKLESKCPEPQGLYKTYKATICLPALLFESCKQKAIE